MNSCWISSIIHLFHSSLIYILNVLFIKTSRDYNCEVSSKRITTSSAFPNLNFSSTEFFKWPLNQSKKRRELFFNKAPFLLTHALLIHNFIPAPTIQPLSCTWTTNAGAISESFGIILHLKMITGLSIVQSAQHVKDKNELQFFRFIYFSTFHSNSSVAWNIKCQRSIVHIRYLA